MIDVDIDITCYNPGDRQRQPRRIAEMLLTLCSFNFFYVSFFMPLKPVNKQ